jgi:hypothetical protein
MAGLEVASFEDELPNLAEEIAFEERLETIQVSELVNSQVANDGTTGATNNLIVMPHREEKSINRTQEAPGVREIPAANLEANLGVAAEQPSIQALRAFAVSNCAMQITYFTRLQCSTSQRHSESMYSVTERKPSSSNIPLLRCHG